MATLTESFARRLTRVLREAFPGATVRLDKVSSSDKVSGFLVWNGFGGVDQIDRQSRLWQILRARLSAEEQMKISAVLTLTPSERGEQ